MSNIKCFEDILEDRKILLRRIRNNIQRKYPEYEIYVFGSYAKGKVRKDSDIDILVKYQVELEGREERDIRWDIEDNLVNEFGYKPEMQIVMYNKENFDIDKKEPGLAGNISEYMLKIE